MTRTQDLHKNTTREKTTVEEKNSLIPNMEDYKLCNINLPSTPIYITQEESNKLSSLNIIGLTNNGFLEVE